MGLDIRWPIGMMFTLIGVLMTGYGVMTGSDAEMYKRSLDININLIWGAVQLAFGMMMLALAFTGARKAAAGAPGGGAS